MTERERTALYEIAPEIEGEADFFDAMCNAKAQYPEAESPHDDLGREAPAYVMWKQRDGAMIRVKDMDDRHLYHAIKMLERNAEARSKRAEKMYGYSEQDFDYEAVFKPVHHAMVKVAEARGIDLSYVEPVVPRPCKPYKLCKRRVLDDDGHEIH